MYLAICISAGMHACNMQSSCFVVSSGPVVRAFRLQLASFSAKQTGPG